jgi:autotransporter passenger strand-loop-strand repeat protein
MTYTAAPGSPVNDLTLSSGDTLYVSTGGSATSVALLTGANEAVASGGTASLTTISADGFVVISSGGLDISATVLAGGYERAESGATTSGGRSCGPASSLHSTQLGQRLLRKCNGSKALKHVDFIMPGNHSYRA